MPSERSHEQKIRLREEGNARNELWRGMSFSEQLQILKSRPGKSKKQRASINRQKKKSEESEK